MVYALILEEGSVGKHLAFGTYPQPAVREVVEVDILSDQFFAHLTALQDDLHAVIGEGELIANVALFAVAQHVVEPGRSESECLMQVVGFGRPNSEPLVEPAYKAGQERVTPCRCWTRSRSAVP